MNRRVIITGGPGSGKTSLLDSLVGSGHCGIPEVSRRIIRQQVAAQSDALPWLNLPAFAQLCLESMLQDYKGQLSQVFYDRGIPDIIGYLQAAGLTAPQELIMAARNCPYFPIVFIAPPWKAIYKLDQERWQSFEEATALHRHIQGVYVSLGYRLVELPLVSVPERVSFVEHELKHWESILEENLCRP